MLRAFLQADYLSKYKLHTKFFASAKIVRLTDGSHEVPGESYFVGDGGDGGENDEALRRVDPTVYSTGKSKSQKENARAFLEAIGVRRVGEVELVEAILKRRYAQGSDQPTGTP